MMLKAITCILSVIAAHGAAYCQGWNGIEPLHSNREDVRRLLGVKSCGNETYDLEDVKVSIVFSEGNCTSEWNVPPGTVLSLDVYPKRAVRFVDLHVDERKFKKLVVDPKVIRYKNFHEGTSIIVQPNGMVTVMSYEPAAKDSHLRCPVQEVTNEQEGDVGFLKIDAYGNISTRAESKRLDEFVTSIENAATDTGVHRRLWRSEILAGRS